MALRSGTKAWMGLAAYVLLWDLWAVKSKKETLSQAFCNGLKHPIKRWRIIALWAYITAHLFTWIPPKYDPLRCIGAKKLLPCDSAEGRMSTLSTV